MPMVLASPAIPSGGEIPVEYTCDGDDLSPPLTWSGLPDGTRSLVLIVEDPDAPSGVFRHWVAFDIPSSTRGLDSGYSAKRPATSFHEARNDFGRVGYSGPCPPKGHGTHHYHFRLLATRRPTLDLNAQATTFDVLKALDPYVIARTELIATYHR